MRHWHATGIILSANDSRDDKVIRLLLETDELVPAIARDGRRARGKSAKASQLQPLSRVAVALRARGEADVAWGEAAESARELALVERIELDYAYPSIKADLARFALASAMCEGVLHLVPDWGVEDGLHALVERALGHLERSSEGRVAAAQERSREGRVAAAQERSRERRDGPREGREAAALERPEGPAGSDLLALFFVRLLDRAGLLPASEELVALAPFAGPPLSPEAAETLALWREGRWRPLPPATSAPTLALLAQLLTNASGRPLLSLPLVTDVLALAPTSLRPGPM
jgi:recombinational DNA repair protein (RecF pathway)